MKIRARELAFTTLIFAAYGIASSAALADSVQGVQLPDSNNTAVNVSGPTVASQETTAFTTRSIDPYYLPKGIPLGAPWRLFPNLFTSVSFDDNVFRVPTNQQSDFYFTINPTLVLDYDTSRARLDLYADANIYQYAKLTTVNTTNFDFGLQGKYEISSASTLQGGTSYSQLSEPLSSPNTSGFQQGPTQYTLYDVNGQVNYQPNRLGITIGGKFDSYRFLNAKLIGGGLLGNKDRDNDDTIGFVQVNYDFSPGYTAFVRAAANTDDYQRVPDRAGIFRSSHGYNFDAGVNLLLGDLVQGSVYLGYVDQFYNQHHTFTIGVDPTLHTLKDVNGLDFGADLTWYPTELLTVHLSASRTLQNTTLAGASAGDDRGVQLAADYELTRRIHLTGRLAYDDVSYQGTATLIPPRPNRADQDFDVGIGGKWLISHYVWANLTYDYTDRNSNIPAAGYHDNTVMLGLNLQI